MGQRIPKQSLVVLQRENRICFEKLCEETLVQSVRSLSFQVFFDQLPRLIRKHARKHYLFDCLCQEGRVGARLGESFGDHRKALSVGVYYSLLCLRAVASQDDNGRT